MAADGYEVPLLGEEEHSRVDIRGALIARDTTVLLHVWAAKQRTFPGYATFLGMVAEGAQKVSFQDPNKCVSQVFHLHPPVLVTSLRPVVSTVRGCGWTF